MPGDGISCRKTSMWWFWWSLQANVCACSPSTLSLRVPVNVSVSSVSVCACMCVCVRGACVCVYEAAYQASRHGRLRDTREAKNEQASSSCPTIFGFQPKRWLSHLSEAVIGRRFRRLHGARRRALDTKRIDRVPGCRGNFGHCV